MRVVPKDDSETTNAFLSQSLVLSKDRTLNTDGKTTFNIMKDRITVVNEKIDYSKNGHRLYWLNTIVGDIKNNIIGIYHGVRKTDLPLFFGEQEYRFNHRNTGKQMMDKVAKYISKSYPIINVNLKMYSFDHLRMYNIDHPYVKPTTKKFITFFEVFRAAS